MQYVVLGVKYFVEGVGMVGAERIFYHFIVFDLYFRLFVFQSVALLRLYGFVLVKLC